VSWRARAPPARGSRCAVAGRAAHPNPSRRTRARARARCARREGAGGARGAWVPPSHARIPRRTRGAGARALAAPLHAPHGAAGGRSPKPSTATPDCERDAHAGWVRGVGAIRGSRPCTRGAHVKPEAPGPARLCWLILLPSPETCGISGRVAEARAELQAHRGPRAARWPSPAAPSARTRSPGCSAEGRRPHARAPTPCGPHPGAPSSPEPWPPAEAPRRVGKTRRGAQQPLLGP